MLDTRYSLIDREGVLDALRGVFPKNLKQGSFPSSPLPKLNRNREVIVGYWNKRTNAAPLPNFIVIRDSDEQEFLAWVSTYCGNITPITQWCRVFSESTVRRISDAVYPSSLGSLSAVWAGAIIGECIAQTRAPVSVNELSMSAAVASYTFPVARCRALWDGNIPLKYIVDRIERSGSLLRSGNRHLPPKDLLEIWEILTELRDPSLQVPKHLTQSSVLIFAACQDIMGTGNITDKTLSYFCELVPAAEKLRNLKEINAEERVDLFDYITKTYSQNGGSSNVDVRRLTEFLAAFLTNRIGGGGTDHLDLLVPLREVFPLAPIWFGVNSALVYPNLWGAEFGGFGRLVQRELTYPLNITEQPRADIAFEELVVSIDPEVGDSLRTFRGAASRIFNVEVAPGVIAGFGISSQKDHEVVQTASNVELETRVKIEGALDAASANLDIVRRLLYVTERSPEGSPFGAKKKTPISKQKKGKSGKPSKRQAKKDEDLLL